MDIKEIGIGSVVVIGGAIYGISEYGLGDVLQDELSPVAEVPMEERAAYMESVTTQFTEFYEGALFGTEEQAYVGEMKYELEPERAAFIEITQSLHAIPKTEVSSLKAYYKDDWLCDTEDSLLFTDKGWTYTTKLKNMDGRTMVIVTCRPTSSPGLRVG